MSTAARRVLLALAAATSWVLLSWLLVGRLLRSVEDLAHHDREVPLLRPRGPAGPAQEQVEARIRHAQEQFASVARPLTRIRQVRRWLDALGEEVEADATIVRVAGAVEGEWVLAPGHDPDRRLLYVHGGGFHSGSPVSHRGVTTALAARTGAAVFAVRYRLQPEHRRSAASTDVHEAWRWLVTTGPDGPDGAATAFAVGDSAGGTLVLELAAHLRDTGGRQADAVAALSPLTDATFSGASWTDNRDRDVFLGPAIGRLLRLSRTAVLAGLWLTAGIRPDDPVLSPARGDLHGLPPTLVQASADEMLRDDAVRWVTKARAAGTRATVQLWPDMVHVFQAFPELPQAAEALDEVAAFLRTAGARAERATV